MRKTNVAWACLAALMLSVAGTAARAEPERYVFDPAHSYLGIAWQHLGFSTSYGHFHDFAGELWLDEENPENSRLSVTIQVPSLIVSTDEFYKHLMDKDFFDAAQHPTATFVSEKVVRTGPQTAQVHGRLTIKGITKPVVLEVALNRIGDHPIRKVKAAGFDARAVIKRSEFAMGAYVPMVSDEVGIFVSTELLRQDER
ncbi:MAG: hypothetical protein KatS3mg119_0958 [Rhodothalassiaceae bacterium]|nr:MAG: hypothetical protein KatS3mg119_0958 [Rhodothalassiaceae bacterium]